MRYFDKLTKTEYINTHNMPVESLPNGVVSLPDSHVFFNQLPSGKVLSFDNDDLPIIVDYVAEPVTVQQAEQAIFDALRKSDYTQLPDFPGDNLSWSLYRESLRDVPEQIGFPADIVWPVEPV